jgi:predicted RNA polymerase sigma factor
MLRRLIAVATIVYLIVLNGYLNGAMKTRIDLALSVLWLALLAIAFVAFGWKTGVTAIAVSLIGACLRRAARLIVTGDK